MTEIYYNIKEKSLFGDVEIQRVLFSYDMDYEYEDLDMVDEFMKINYPNNYCVVHGKHYLVDRSEAHVEMALKLRF